MTASYADRTDGVVAYEVRTPAEAAKDGLPVYYQRYLTGTQRSIALKIIQATAAKYGKAPGDNTAGLAWVNKAIGWAMRWAVNNGVWCQWDEGRPVKT